MRPQINEECSSCAGREYASTILDYTHAKIYAVPVYRCTGSNNIERCRALMPCSKASKPSMDIIFTVLAHLKVPKELTFSDLCRAYLKLKLRGH